jgi:hypothetical protein
VVVQVVDVEVVWVVLTISFRCVERLRRRRSIPRTRQLALAQATTDIVTIRKVIIVELVVCVAVRNTVIRFVVGMPKNEEQNAIAPL